MFLTANDGHHVVLVTFVEKHRPGNTGHIAIIVPSRRAQYSESWHAYLPYIAEAGAPVELQSTERSKRVYTFACGLAVEKREIKFLHFYNRRTDPAAGDTVAESFKRFPFNPAPVIFFSLKQHHGVRLPEATPRFLDKLGAYFSLLPARRSRPRGTFWVRKTIAFRRRSSEQRSGVLLE